MRFLLQSDEPRPAAYGVDFRIVGSAREIEELIRVRTAQGHSFRLTDGFCWPLSEILGGIRNQIAAATRMGVRAVTINSDNQDEWDSVEARGAPRTEDHG